MPKIILEFDADTERDAAELAQKAGAYKSVLTDLDSWLRSCVKHDAPILEACGSATETDHKYAEVIRERIHRLCEDYEVSLW